MTGALKTVKSTQEGEVGDWCVEDSKSTQEIEKGDCCLRTVKVPRRERRVIGVL